MLARKLLRNDTDVHRTSYRHLRGDRGEVGVGTLIIFIAMVLVAAVAAAVIIGTAGNLQQRAQQTGKEATQEISSNLKVVDIYASRDDPTHDLQHVKLQLELSAGSQPVDLSQLVIRYSDGNTVVNYITGSANDFTLDWIRPSTGGPNVMKSGDLVELTFDAPSELVPRSPFEVQLLPETGSPVDLQLKTPSTYGSQTTLSLTK